MQANYESHRDRPEEKERIEDLMRLLSGMQGHVLDIGARDGYVADKLTGIFSKVTAIDLEKPAFELTNVVVLQGDVTCLEFPDDEFDVVLCAEVLEHLPKDALANACREISRVCKGYIVIGVPYRQDIRVGRTKCSHCGCINPPWGHINSFDESRLEQLFLGTKCISTTYVGKIVERTNALSALLMDIAGNPWGTYEQEECCVSCGGEISSPRNYSLRSRALSKIASIINRAQNRFTRCSPIWIHMVFTKESR